MCFFITHPQHFHIYLRIDLFNLQCNEKKLTQLNSFFLMLRVGNIRLKARNVESLYSVQYDNSEFINRIDQKSFLLAKQLK